MQPTGLIIVLATGIQFHTTTRFNHTDKTLFNVSKWKGERKKKATTEKPSLQVQKVGSNLIRFAGKMFTLNIGAINHSSTKVRNLVYSPHFSLVKPSIFFILLSSVVDLWFETTPAAAQALYWTDLASPPTCLISFCFVSTQNEFWEVYRIAIKFQEISFNLKKEKKKNLTDHISGFLDSLIKPIKHVSRWNMAAFVSQIWSSFVRHLEETVWKKKKKAMRIKTLSSEGTDIT